MSEVWTAEQVKALGVRTDVETAGSIFGLSRTQAYEAVNGNRFPVPTFRIGRRVVVPVAPILALLGIDTPIVANPSVVDEIKAEGTDANHESALIRTLRG